MLLCAAWGRRAESRSGAVDPWGSRQGLFSVRSRTLRSGSFPASPLGRRLLSLPDPLVSCRWEEVRPASHSNGSPNGALFESPFLLVADRRRGAEDGAACTKKLCVTLGRRTRIGLRAPIPASKCPRCFYSLSLFMSVCRALPAKR